MVPTGGTIGAWVKKKPEILVPKGTLRVLSFDPQDFEGGTPWLAPPSKKINK